MVRVPLTSYDLLSVTAWPRVSMACCSVVDTTTSSWATAAWQNRFCPRWTKPTTEWRGNPPAAVVASIEGSLRATARGWAISAADDPRARHEAAAICQVDHADDSDDDDDCLACSDTVEVAARYLWAGCRREGGRREVAAQKWRDVKAAVRATRQLMVVDRIRKKKNEKDTFAKFV